MNENIETKVEKLRPFTRILMTIGELPTSYLMSMTYYEQIIWFTKYLQETVIPTVNNNATAVEEVQNVVIELQNYVNNYFDNLDVQEEINNKLDEMVEDGTLQEIITDYLNTKAIFAFDNVNSMKQATNLINGSYAKTLGYYSVNDGGSSTYKIVNDELTADDKLIIELNNGLFAVLVYNDYLYPEQIGGIGNDTFDNTNVFQTLLDNLINIKLLTGKTYKVTETLKLKSNVIIDLNNSTINSTDKHLFYNFLENSTATLYNGNGNIIIKNGIIKGGCISLMHADNVILENITFIEPLNNHNVELCSCKNVDINNCKFYEITGTGGRLESVNIDPCTHDSFPWLPLDSVSYDGTPCSYINVHDCLFDGGSNNKIEDGVGCHNESVNHHTFINIYNNVVKNVTSYGFMIRSCDNSKVFGNTIVSTYSGVAVGGNNNAIYQNKITSTRTSETWVIHILENSLMLSAYDNNIITNGKVAYRYINIGNTLTCTFARVDNYKIDFTKTTDTNTTTATITTNGINLTDYNNIKIQIGRQAQATFKTINIDSFFGRNFQVGDGFYIEDLDATMVITSQNVLTFTSTNEVDLIFIILNVK